ncbi:hypothetical protein DERP_012001 [Dermatophagoides pteronyssinus]|uniref:Uncharacterized protein n=1 Tax=Dermatophagoides pteronyssinus TaxID=6956 RepID=A0ABQ8IVP2_DERPT|nr:hypothetical protein DERP_012001 [Dermatophagoides pteronyssinus]
MNIALINLNRKIYLSEIRLCVESSSNGPAILSMIMLLALRGRMGFCLVDSCKLWDSRKQQQQKSSNIDSGKAQAKLSLKTYNLIVI